MDAEEGVFQAPPNFTTIEPYTAIASDHIGIAATYIGIALGHNPIAEGCNTIAVTYIAIAPSHNLIAAVAIAYVIYPMSDRINLQPMRPLRRFTKSDFWREIIKKFIASQGA